MTNHSDDLLHIASCRTCRDRFTADNVVNFEADRHREPERMREFLETARRLERERTGVKDVVGGLLRTTPPPDWPSLASAPELQSSAAVEQLIEEVRGRVERTPTEALTLAEVATAIAESLPKSHYPAVVLAQLRASAWKERANTLRYLSRYEEALSAIEFAEEHLAGFSSVTFDRAVVGLVKAMVLHGLNETDTANELLRECRSIFEDYGDARMLLCAGMIEGAHLYDKEEYARAQEVFRQLGDTARATRDSESLARIENNLGYCATHIGDYREANIHFSNSIALFNDMGARLEATRAERGAGRMMINKGQISAGLTFLRNARRAFAEASIAEDAALCGLEIVETLLERGDTTEASELAHQIAEEVAAAGLPGAAVTALERLDYDVRAGGSEVVSHVRQVRTLLESLQPQTITA